MLKAKILSIDTMIFKNSMMFIHETPNSKKVIVGMETPYTSFEANKQQMMNFLGSVMYN